MSRMNDALIDKMNAEPRNVKTTIKRKASTGEWVVRLHINGVHQKDADYFTDDKKDAEDTALAMVNARRKTAVKHFTIDDLDNWKGSPSGLAIRVFKDDLKSKSLDWQRRGLQQTASGYGRKLTSSRMIFFEGRLRRIYITQFSNAGTAWFIYKGEKIVVID